MPFLSGEGVPSCQISEKKMLESLLEKVFAKVEGDLD